MAIGTIPGVQPTLSRGSEWRKWDLHIHSPASALNNQFPKLGDGTPDWDQYISALEKLSDIAVLGITDYFSIEGYRKLLECRAAGRLKNVSLILPNIEFRLDKLIGRGAKRLNYHVIFSEAIAHNDIEEHFLHELKFRFEGDPQRDDLSYSIRRENLELLGRRLKREHTKFDDHRSDYEIGCITATVDSSEIKRVLHNKERIFKGKYLIVLAEEYTSLLDWDDGQDHLTRKILLQGADVIFSANPKTIAWARGESAMSADDFRHEFKTLKPCLHGSDAHRLEDLGRPAEDRFCWIKAQPTFEGLRQVLFEPRERVFIGDVPPNLKHDYQVLDSVEMAGATTWFTATRIPLSRDLVAVIGPRGSGKSALAEMIAFAGGAETFRESTDIQDAFLYKASRRSAANPAPIVSATITLLWSDGTREPVTVPANLKHGRVEEKVKYLPQKFVERLCSPEHNRQLEQEIERVIFQRIDKTERLDASDFQELRQASTHSIGLKRAQLERTIQTLNQNIAAITARIALRPAKEAELKTKRDELTALLRNPPQMPGENKEELERLTILLQKKQELEAEVIRTAEQQQTISGIESRFTVMRQEVETFSNEIAALLEKVGLSGQREAFEIHVPDVAALLAAKREELSRTTQVLRQGTGADDLSLAAVNQQIDEIKARSRLTEAKRREYEKFQKDRQQIEDTIASLEREIKEISESLTPKLKEHSETRVERYVDAFDLLKEERAVLEKLYRPLHDALAVSNETARKLKFVCKMTFDVQRHASRGMELLDRRKALYRDQVELEDALKRFFTEVEADDFDRTKARAALHVLRDTFLSQGGNGLRVEDQLRKDRNLKDFADWFYSIDDFAVSYSIEFDGKDLQLLSPGEKGIVLLLLYLEAETDDNRPLVIDQPDDNLDNVSVYPSLIEYFRTRKKTRQVIIITHNPNLVVNTDGEQVVVANFDGGRVPKIIYRSGALEDTHPSGPVLGVREEVCRVLEGGSEAFQLREQRYAISQVIPRY